jgi:hypothetical protein
MNEKTVRLAIAEQIKLALADYYSTIDTGMEVVVHDHWVLTFDISRSAGAIRPIEGTDRAKIHGWMIGLQSLERDNEVVGQDLKQLFKVNRGCDPNTIRETGGKRRQVFATFKVWAFVQTNLGEVDNESQVNSENTLSAELEHVSNWFSKNLSLGMTSANGFVGHTELQFKQIAIFDFGESMANGAKGTISAAWYEFL